MNKKIFVRLQISIQKLSVAFFNCQRRLKGHPLKVNDEQTGLGPRFYPPVVTEQSYWSMTVWIFYGLHRLWDRDCKRPSPDLENFESVQVGIKEVT